MCFEFELIGPQGCPKIRLRPGDKNSALGDESECTPRRPLIIERPASVRNPSGLTKPGPHHLPFVAREAEAE
jgi:hypothetical protein